MSCCARNYDERCTPNIYRGARIFSGRGIGGAPIPSYAKISFFKTGATAGRPYVHIVSFPVFGFENILANEFLAALSAAFGHRMRPLDQDRCQQEQPECLPKRDRLYPKQLWKRGVP